jgi:hypothetical protein
MLVIQHLITLLQDLEQQGRIKGEIVLVPFANPIGMMQNVLGHWTGRFNIADGQNFNRNFSDIYQELCIRNPMLETDLKQIVSNIMHHLQPIDTVSYMKHVLLKEALKHDIVLDLHSDTSAVLHLYSNIKHAKKASTLAGALGAQVVFVEEFAGGQPFDETIFRCWKWFVEKDYINYDKIPFSVTVELRGHSDVSDELAYQDAKGIVEFLANEGLIDLSHVVDICEDDVILYPLEGASHLSATANGLITWKKVVGEPVKKGEHLGDIIDLFSGIRTKIISDVDGILVVQPLMKLIRIGQRVALLAGKEKNTNRCSGNLLNDF